MLICDICTACCHTALLLAVMMGGGGFLFVVGFVCVFLRDDIDLAQERE